MDTPGGRSALPSCVLLVEDDAGIGRVVRNGLRNHAIEVDWLRSGEGMLEQLASKPYGAIILDLMLPGRDGLSLCRELRARGVLTPVCMLTARDALEDKLEGFDVGADDYLTKPFAIDELVARLRVLLRRRSVGGEAALVHGDLTLDRGKREARVAGRALSLTRREFDTLAHLLANAGEAVSREALLDAVWEDGSSVTANSVDVYIGYLRRKLTAASASTRIEAVRGIGFKLR